MDYDPVGYQEVVCYLIARRRRRKRCRQVQVEKMPLATPGQGHPPTIRIDFPGSLFYGDEPTEEGATPTLKPFLVLYFDDDRIRVEHRLSLDVIPPEGWTGGVWGQDAGLSNFGPWVWRQDLGSYLYADPQMLEKLCDVLRQVGIDIPDEHLDVPDRKPVDSGNRVGRRKPTATEGPNQTSS